MYGRWTVEGWSKIRVLEFVCVQILSQPEYFSEQVPIAHNKEREPCIPLLHVVSRKFLKGESESKGRKSTHTLPLRKTSKKETENQNYQQLLQILARWVYYGVVIFTKNDQLKRLWNNSQNLKITPSRGKTKI